MTSYLIILIAAVLGLALRYRYAATRGQIDHRPLVEKIDAILPQTQCGQCSYSGCKPYAQAIANGEADINQCPPGGDEGIRHLANLLGREIKPLSPEHGVHKPKAVALIDEQICIGCTLCIQACPVDAIVGAAKQMHTVVAAQCTGCELCLPPCPVDCISMEPIAETVERSKWPYPIFAIKSVAEVQKRRLADEARERYVFRQFREERDKEERAARLAAKAVASKERIVTGQNAPATGIALSESEPDAKKALIAAALARARAQQQAIPPQNIATLTTEQAAQIKAIEARRAERQSTSKIQPTNDDPSQ